MAAKEAHQAAQLPPGTSLTTSGAFANVLFRPLSKARLLSVLTAILLVAAFLRLYGLNNLSPPGLEHDEVAHWLINQRILEGEHTVYFREAYGHEAGFHYLQAGFMVLLGDNALSLRLPSAFSGLLLVAVTYALTQRLFGRPTALAAAGLSAVLLWPIFYSRLALRAISLPLVSGLAAYFWWRGWDLGSHDRGRKSPLGYYSVAGVLAGFSLYTYMASRALPIFFVMYIAYLSLFHRRRLASQRRYVILFFALFALTAGPLVLYLITNPGAEYRISEVDAPLRAFLSGDLWPAIQNTLKVAGMVAFRGDPLWRQNVAFLPVFDPLIGAFFYLGLFISLWKWREPRYMYLILWLLSSSIPSIVTIDAPSYIRISNVLPLIGAFPPIGAQVIHRFRHLSTIIPRLSPDLDRLLIVAGLSLIFLGHAVRSARALFFTWPAESEVQFVWQAALTEAAAYLDASDQAGPVAVGGWTPGSMDPPTMALTLRREDLALRFFNPQEAVIVPVTPADASARVIRPLILSPHPYLEEKLAAWGAQETAFDTFVLYRLPANIALKPGIRKEATFGDQATLLGFDKQPDCPPVAAVCWLATYWQIQRASVEPRRIFVHQIGSDGQILAQDDRLGAPSEHWQAGDLLLQLLWLPEVGEESRSETRLGFYNPVTGERLLTRDGTDFVILEWD